MNIISSFAQKAGSPAFSFGEKSGSITMSWDEFFKTKKEISAFDSTMKIKSFMVSFKILSGDFAGFTDQPNMGNKFSDSTVAFIEKIYKEKRIGNKILIEQVFAEKNGTEIKLPGMVITMK